MLHNLINKFYNPDLRHGLEFDCNQWRIQDFPELGASTLQGEGAPNFPKNCMKLKEFGPPGGRVPRVPLRSATGN